MKTAFRMMVAAVWTLLIVCSGCTSTPVAKQFEQIGVGVTTSSEVFALLPEQGLMHSGDAVSTYQKQGDSHELGVVAFNEQDSQVRRKIYLHTSGKLAVPPFTEQHLYLFLQTEVPATVLEGLYESDAAKQVAILRYCQESFVEDSRKFSQDQKTQSMMGMGRATLSYGLDQLASRPRETYRLPLKGGFDFLHPVVGKCRLYLHPNAETVYTLELTASDWVDPVDKW